MLHALILVQKIFHDFYNNPLPSRSCREAPAWRRLIREVEHGQLCSQAVGSLHWPDEMGGTVPGETSEETLLLLPPISTCVSCACSTNTGSRSMSNQPSPSGAPRHPSVSSVFFRTRGVRRRVTRESFARVYPHLLPLYPLT